MCKYMHSPKVEHTLCCIDTKSRCSFKMLKHKNYCQSTTFFLSYSFLLLPSFTPSLPPPFPFLSLNPSLLLLLYIVQFHIPDSSNFSFIHEFELHFPVTPPSLERNITQLLAAEDRESILVLTPRRVSKVCAHINCSPGIPKPFPTTAVLTLIASCISTESHHCMHFVSFSTTPTPT